MFGDGVVFAVLEDPLVLPVDLDRLGGDVGGVGEVGVGYPVLTSCSALSGSAACRPPMAVAMAGVMSPEASV